MRCLEDELQATVAHTSLKLLMRRKSLARPGVNQVPRPGLPLAGQEPAGGAPGTLATHTAEGSAARALSWADVLAETDRTAYLAVFSRVLLIRRSPGPYA